MARRARPPFLPRALRRAPPPPGRGRRGRPGVEPGRGRPPGSSPPSRRPSTPSSWLSSWRSRAEGLRSGRWPWHRGARGARVAGRQPTPRCAPGPRRSARGGGPGGRRDSSKGCRPRTWSVSSESRFDLAVAVPVPGRKAFLALGPKRSGEPWDREEREMLATIATGLGMLLRSEDSGVTAVTRRAPVARGRTVSARASAGERRDGCRVRGDGPRPRAPRRGQAPPRGRGSRRNGARERFRREARALAAFSHPNVVTIHDFGVSSDGRAFLVMEFLEGPTLRVLLRQEGPLPPRRAPSRSWRASAPPWRRPTAAASSTATSSPRT